MYVSMRGLRAWKGMAHRELVMLLLFWQRETYRLVLRCKNLAARGADHHDDHFIRSFFHEEFSRHVAFTGVLVP